MKHHISESGKILNKKSIDNIESGFFKQRNKYSRACPPRDGKHPEPHAEYQLEHQPHPENRNTVDYISIQADTVVPGCPSFSGS